MLSSTGWLSRTSEVCLALALAFTLTACAEQSAPESGPFAEMASQGLTRYLGAASPAETVEGGGYTTWHFDPADGPRCLRGAPFVATARDGDANNLIIYLQGGGACWSGLCQAIEVSRAEVHDNGILNRALPGNPVADWSVAYIPYCDGSLFLGDVDVDEGGNGDPERYHRGLRNLSAALDAAKARYPSPDRLLVVGISAGAYGTVFSAMLIRTLWPGVPMDIVADGGFGIGRPGDPSFIENILEEWGASDLVPASCKDCFADGHAINFTSWALERDPLMTYAVVSSLEDLIISEFFLEIGPEIYREEALKQTSELASSHPGRVARFLYEGQRHTSLVIDTGTDLATATLPFQGGEVLDTILERFDVASIDGMPLTEWLTMWLTQDPAFTSLTHEGP